MRRARANPLGPAMLLVRECAEFMRMSEGEFRRSVLAAGRVRTFRPTPRKTLIRRDDFENMLSTYSTVAVYEPPARRRGRASS